MLETRKIGNKDLTLPGHMFTLPQKIIDVLCVLPDASKRVISCGVDPQDGGLYLVSAALEVKVVTPNGVLKPSSAFPSHDGKTLGVTLHGVESLQSIDSALALRHAEDCLKDANLMVNDTYVARLQTDASGDKHEDQTERPQDDDSRGS